MVLQDVEFKDHPEKTESDTPVPLDQRESEEHPVTMELMVKMVLTVNLALDTPVLKEILDMLDHKVHPDHQDMMEHLVPLESQVCPEVMDTMVLMVNQEELEPLVSQVI